jgi:hypothetical protein
LIGIIWIPLWIYHGFNYYLLKGFYVVGILELLIVLPIGFALIYDWFAFGRLKKPNFIEQPLWNISDFAFFFTGISGIITLVVSLFLTFEKSETFVMGLLGIAIAFVHFLRRRVRILGHL